MVITRVLYITKPRDSFHGVARYSRAFERALVKATGGIVDRRSAGHTRPTGDQIRSALDVFRWLSAARRCDLVWVDMSGRSIAEMWFCYLATRTRLRRRLAIVVHDPPAICGGIGWVRLLDRRGLRRVASFLSAKGRKVELSALSRAAVVACLSPSGAQSVQEVGRVDRPVFVLPIAIESRLPRTSHRPTVFVPGPLQQQLASDVAGLAMRVDGIRILLGASSGSSGLSDPVERTGWLTDSDLDEVFDEASVILHLVDPRSSGGASRAVSLPVIEAMSRGIPVVSNSPRASVDYLSGVDPAPLLFEESNVEPAFEMAVLLAHSNRGDYITRHHAFVRRHGFQVLVTTIQSFIEMMPVELDQSRRRHPLA